MDTRTFAKDQPVVEGANGSRLPAGSTLEVNGIHVPHPHAEANLAGAGDTRLGDTKAVTETYHPPVGDEPGHIETRPLADEVKPRRLTIDPDAPKLADLDAKSVTGAVAPAKLELKEDPANKVVELPK